MPNTSCFAVPGIHAEYLAFLLAQKNVFVTYGGGRVQKLEHMLVETGVPRALAKSAISIAISMDTGENEIKEAIVIIADTVNECRRVMI